MKSDDLDPQPSALQRTTSCRRQLILDVVPENPSYSLVWDNVQIDIHRVHQSLMKGNHIDMMALSFAVQHRTPSLQLKVGSPNSMWSHYINKAPITFLSYGYTYIWIAHSYYLVFIGRSHLQGCRLRGVVLCAYLWRPGCPPLPHDQVRCWDDAWLYACLEGRP